MDARSVPMGDRSAESVGPGRLAPQRLHRAAAGLVVEAARPRGERRPGGEARLLALLRPHEQGRETRPGVLPIARLARESLGENDDDAVLSRARPSEPDEPDRDV